MDIRYNLSQLFNAAFGISSPIFIPYPIKILEKQTGVAYDGLEYLPEYHKKSATSWMGTPILGQCTFKAGPYLQYKTDGSIGDVYLIENPLPPATLFTFRRAKNITKTNLLGANGTVKEIFGFDDWIIDVKGLALDDPEYSAEQYMSRLRTWESLACAINVKGKLFSRKEIHAVVMEYFREESVQGMPGVIPFSMTLTSDEAIELILPEGSPEAAFGFNQQVNAEDNIATP